MGKDMWNVANGASMVLNISEIAAVGDSNDQAVKLVARDDVCP